MKLRPVAFAVLAVAALLAACSQVVDGSGSAQVSAGPSGSASVDFPSGSASGSLTPPIETPSPSLTGSASGSPAAGQDFSCPTITYPLAHLAFQCIVATMTPETNDKVWPLREFDTVEPTTNWSMDMGAGHWGQREGRSLGEITVNVRQQMLGQGAYGTSPTVTTTASDDKTVAGVPAHVLQTTFTLNRAFAKKRHTKVKIEKLWIVALEVGTDDVSLWYVSVPDLAKSHWPDVDDAIGSIRVG